MTAADPEAAPVRCPRCQSDDIEALGRVHSSLYWFSCYRCHCIWWLRSLPADRGVKIATREPQ